MLTLCGDATAVHARANGAPTIIWSISEAIIKRGCRLNRTWYGNRKSGIFMIDC
jgi:hypothetical protein